MQVDSLISPHFPSHPEEGLPGGEQARLVGALIQKLRSLGGGAETPPPPPGPPRGGTERGAFPDIPGGGAVTGVESRSLSHREAEGGGAALET